MKSKSILLGLIIGIAIGGLVGFIAPPSQDPSRLENQVEQLQRRVTALQSDVESRESEISELEAEMSTLQSEKSTLESSLKMRDDEISGLENHVTELEYRAESLENELLKLSSQADFTFVDVSFSRTEDTSSTLQYWIGRANETVQVMVMLITQDELADAIVAAHNRHVDVEIIIDDDWLYSSGSDYQKILDAGIDIRGDERGGLMHHKVMIIDGHVVVVGSYNWSGSAEDSNDDNIIILKSTTIAETYLSEFERLWSQTTPATQ